MLADGERIWFSETDVQNRGNQKGKLGSSGIAAKQTDRYIKLQKRCQRRIFTMTGDQERRREKERGRERIYLGTGKKNCYWKSLRSALFLYLSYCTGVSSALCQHANEDATHHHRINFMSSIRLILSVSYIIYYKIKSRLAP